MTYFQRVKCMACALYLNQAIKKNKKQMLQILNSTDPH